jgi:DNA-binding Xre family transcriptional regulator
MPDMEHIQIPRITLDDVMKSHKISLNRLAIVSGVPKTTLHRVVRNNSSVVRLEHLQAILNALCELTGHCYDVNDIIKVHYKEQGPHASLRDKACDPVVDSENPVDMVTGIQQFDNSVRVKNHNEQ